MNIRIATLAAGLALTMTAFLPAVTASAQERVVQVGGAPMFPSRNIVQNAVNSKVHTTLVAAVQAAGLADTLQTPGPFTVFAPVNTAFDKLPAGTVPTLLKPENKATLSGVLTYHVVAGKLSADDLRSRVQQGGGRTTLKTVQGGNLTVTAPSRNRLRVVDSKGRSSNITIADVNQSNGVIHVVDSVLLPN